tara:strand:+ start:2679 stop:3146 length:468 start_codon:yes stop_codon:yes gene_type:complete
MSDAPYNIQDFGPSDLLSSEIEGERRVKVINDSENDSIHRVYSSGAVSITGGSDTEILIEGMAPGNDRAYFEVLFWTDDTMTVLAYPTAGTVVIEGAVSDTNFWRSIPSGDFLSADANDPGRPIPEALGPMRSAKITISSTTDVATHVSVTIDKY